MNLSKLKSFSSKGFTLIELLIVIAILGILATAIMVAINPGQKLASARNSRVRADLTALGSEANIFNTESGVAGCTSGYPTTFNFSAIGCTGTTPVYRASGAPASPGTAYSIAGSTSTSVGIWGPSFNDGVNTSTNGWCWKSSTGQISADTTDASCP